MHLAGILVSLFFSLAAHAADWTGFKGCGLYEVRGVIKFEKNVPTMVVNEGTKSEIKISVPIENEPRLSAYIDRPFIAEVEMKTKMNGSLGTGTVMKIDSRLPHPLNPMDTGMKFLKKSECAK